MSKKAELRICASCEWIFKRPDKEPDCPRCGFGSYSAHYVHRSKAYYYAKTQALWKRNQMKKYEAKLDEIIRRRNRK